VEIKNDLIMQLVSFLLGGVVSKLIDFALGKKKNDAETDVIVSDNWQKYAEKIETQFEKLRVDYEALGTKYFALLTDYQEFKVGLIKKENLNNIKNESFKDN
jgi:hypothetical protein